MIEGWEAPRTASIRDVALAEGCKTSIRAHSGAYERWGCSGGFVEGAEQVQHEVADPLWSLPTAGL